MFVLRHDKLFALHDIGPQQLKIRLDSNLPGLTVAFHCAALHTLPQTYTCYMPHARLQFCAMM